MFCSGRQWITTPKTKNTQHKMINAKGKYMWLDISEHNIVLLCSVVTVTSSWKKLSCTALYLVTMYSYVINIYKCDVHSNTANRTYSRGVQRWTVHFGISDVFQRFLGHLKPLNQNPSDATLAPLSILQNSRWRPRWPPSEWKLLKWPYFLCY